jgi:hypothetical protein
MSAAVPQDHAEKIKAGVALFRDRVGLLLRENCLECHGGQQVKGDFNLASLELASRMQTQAPEVFDLAGEPELVRQASGLHAPHCGPFARQCITARRLLERGGRGRPEGQGYLTSPSQIQRLQIDHVVADGLERVPEHQAGTIESLDLCELSTPAATKIVHEGEEAKTGKTRKSSEK